MHFVKDLKNHSKQYIRLFGTGFAMGTADLVPGVSGGTVAFLSGIYEELLFTIKVLSGEFLKTFLFKRDFKKAFSLVPFRFVVPLGLGLVTALFSLAGVLSFLLNEYPMFVWAFFFGLVLASTWIVLNRVVKWDMSDKISLVISTIITYIVVGAIPIETPNTLPVIFLSGVVAICAMILPGISGSFILLLLGKYNQVLDAVTNRDFLTLGVLFLGCVVGISLFARVLSWLFKEHHDISVAILAGVMLGSVRKIWPWQEVVSTRINSHGEEVPFIVNNVMPKLDNSLWAVLFLIFLGVGLMVYVNKMQLTQEQVEDIENSSFKKEHKKALKNQ